MAENRPVKESRQNVVEQFQNRHRSSPHLTTIHGPVEWNDVPNVLRENSGSIENEKEIVAFSEYYRNGELVHRSVHVHLKRPTVNADAEVQSF